MEEPDVSKSKDLAAVIRAHVDACCAEIRAEVEREFAAAIAGLGAGVRSEAAGVAKARVSRPGSRKPSPTRDRRGKSQAVRSGRESATATPSRRTCGCAATGRHRKECALAKPPQPVERSPKVERAGNGADSPRMKPPVDTARAERFAKLEERVKARMGAAAA